VITRRTGYERKAIPYLPTCSMCSADAAAPSKSRRVVVVRQCLLLVVRHRESRASPSSLAIRQEPSRRSQRTPAHGARFRRVLRQSLPPERRGGALAAARFKANISAPIMSTGLPDQAGQRHPSGRRNRKMHLSSNLGRPCEPCRPMLGVEPVALRRLQNRGALFRETTTQAKRNGRP
jgi:hypothetical protein